MTKVIFIGATGTDIGKTYVTCLLLRQLREQGHRVRAIKPIISGFDENNIPDSDTGKLLSAMDLATTLENAKKISPWRYEAPLPPHQLAENSGAPLNLDQLTGFCQEQAAAPLDYLLIEGVGGIMTPINYQQTTLDLIKKLDCQTLLVTGSMLGTYSHTLTAVTVLKQSKIRISSVILSESIQNFTNFDEVFNDFTKILPKIRIIKIPRNSQGENLISSIT